MINLDSFTKIGRDGAEATMRSFSAVSTGMQTIATENVDYMKRAVEQGQKVAEQLMGAKSLDVAVQIQGDFLRSSYEGLVAQTSKIGELAASVAKDAAAPIEGLMAKKAA